MTLACFAASSSALRRASRPISSMAPSAASAPFFFSSLMVRSISARASSTYFRASSRLVFSTVRSRSRTLCSRFATVAIRSRASSTIAAASCSRTASSSSFFSSRSMSAAMSRSPCGRRSSARATTFAGRLSRRAMLMPYDLPGIPLIRRYVGASCTASNCSDAFTTPGTWVASSLSWPRCVDASVVVPRAVRVSRIAQPSAAPSCGSVPDPSSSMRASESLVARRRISERFLRCALKVERLASMDCSSPMSASTSSNTGIVLSAPTGAGMPACDIIDTRPSALSNTVLPPVFGPETSSVRSSGWRARSKGTTSAPFASSSG